MSVSAPASIKPKTGQTDRQLWGTFSTIVKVFPQLHLYWWTPVLHIPPTSIHTMSHMNLIRIVTLSSGKIKSFTIYPNMIWKIAIDLCSFSISIEDIWRLCGSCCWDVESCGACWSWWSWWWWCLCLCVIEILWQNQSANHENLQLSRFCCLAGQIAWGVCWCLTPSLASRDISPSFSLKTHHNTKYYHYITLSLT